MLAKLFDALRGNREARRTLKQRLRGRWEQAKRIRRKIRWHRERRGLPSWLPTRHAEKWRRPWTKEAREHKEFRALLWNHGYLSPHFTAAEAASKDGTPIPEAKREKAQDHAFALEQVRHRVGDKPMRMLSWYRSPSHNAAVGGATQSQHLEARATDWSDAERIRLGSDTFNRAMKDVFADGGIGTYQGHVRHVDSRGYEARWTY